MTQLEFGALENFHDGQPNRARTFRQLQWNSTFYVYIPVCIPIAARHEVAVFLKKVARVVPGLYLVNAGCVALSNILWKDDDHHNLNDQVALGKEFHISLGRTVPIQLHHIDSVVAMLRHRLRFQRRYWIEFSKWEVFVNDNRTRTFLSLEVTSTGLVQITNQIQAVNEVYKRHHLPEFYKDPHPHISLAWALGDIKNSLKIVIEDQEKRSGVGGSFKKHCIFTSRFNGIECRIGTNTYEICKFVDI